MPRIPSILKESIKSQISSPKSHYTKLLPSLLQPSIDGFRVWGWFSYKILLEIKMKLKGVFLSSSFSLSAKLSKKWSVFGSIFTIWRLRIVLVKRSSSIFSPKYLSFPRIFPNTPFYKIPFVQNSLISHNLYHTSHQLITLPIYTKTLTYFNF